LLSPLRRERTAACSAPLPRSRHEDHHDLDPVEDVLPHPPPRWHSDPLNRLLFASELVTIGAFWAPPQHPLFRNSGPIEKPIFVFPRTSVLLQYAGSRPFATDPNVVTFYNAGQVYWRQAIDPAGDRCEWFEVRADVLLDMLGRIDPHSAERPERPFGFNYGPSDTRSYLVQRTLARHVVASRAAVEILAVEETVLGLLSRVVRAALDLPEREVPVQRGHWDLAMRVKEILGRCFHETRSLDELSREAGCSPFYLARVFRRVDGRSIHQYRLQLRLARSLERVATRTDLRQVAQSLGFSSHSHFTAAFRRAFGISPSEFRRRASTTLLHSLLATQQAPRAYSLP
jgi:AraC-like DNA-binding protein